ncbi:hypothetical protein [Umezawaea sp. Da 62-37]|uniref:hypothetical protein n=1 Tax=Umezawaea sp. Da 62-37 TaxID=3075927 RepID=UPI0028F727C6|nr:hypothetical protein [Umezawaea sp. Da 62-37]WNV86598.1 hypothetical protein RM788_52220 [Umezawaea sp. Da 62-37]
MAREPIVRFVPDLGYPWEIHYNPDGTPRLLVHPDTPFTRHMIEMVGELLSLDHIGCYVCNEVAWRVLGVPTDTGLAERLTQAIADAAHHGDHLTIASDGTMRGRQSYECDRHAC